MNRNLPKPFVATRRVITYNGSIEWEELPSLSERLARPTADGELDLPARRAWDDTEPSAFDAFATSASSAPAPLREPLEGLIVSEVSSPEVFQHFFGTPPRR